MVLLEIRDVGKVFGEFVALNGVTSAIEEGETRAIIGPNGAGKTTLINVVTGLLRATVGEIFLNGENITRLPAHSIARRGLIRTYQIASLFRELSVRDNLEVALVAGRKYGARYVGQRSADDVDAEHLIELVGLGPVARYRVINISHGDQRLLEVAVALAARPQVLLLDEPTAGMSPAETANFIRMMKSHLRRHYTVILVEHDMDVVMETADRITVLEGGAVLAEGGPGEIRGDTRVQEAYLGRSTAQ